MSMLSELNSLNLSRCCNTWFYFIRWRLWWRWVWRRRLPSAAVIIPSAPAVRSATETSLPAELQPATDAEHCADILLSTATAVWRQRCLQPVLQLQPRIPGGHRLPTNRLYTTTAGLWTGSPTAGIPELSELLRGLPTATTAATIRQLWHW